MHLYAGLLKKPIAAVLILAICAVALYAQHSGESKFTITPDVQAALNQISADSLRGHLSFIASDLLKGRNTPSPGLDTAAEYIAAQFRRAGLEPAGDDGYFQTAPWLMSERSMQDFELKIEVGKNAINVPKERVSVNADGALILTRAAVIKIDYTDEKALASLTPEFASGKVVITEMPDFRREERARWPEVSRAQNEFRARMATLKVSLVISVDRAATAGSGGGAGRLIDPENRSSARRPSAVIPFITVHEPAIVPLYEAMKSGRPAATLSVNLSAPVESPVKLRNIVGVLRGSHPVLKETFVLITSHYDHIGMRVGGEGDTIFNGANDDGSGTVAVIELASALARLKQRPKRSIVFVTFFGEEKGLLGSRYYSRHPVFPIEKTVSDVNLEQVGRTDSSEGPQLSNASMTGYDYSEVGTIFKAAGEMTGVNVYKHPTNSDSFFGRSDNQALADQGVPAHTLCVAYVYPDYHGVGDHWDKIDYTNMEKVTRMVALGLIMIAESAEEPRWNESNPKAARYVKAWKERRR